MKEKIIEILTNWLQAKDSIIFTDNIAIDEVADEILALLKKEIEQEPIDKFPYIDFRRNIAEELSRDELINRLCEMNVKYRKMREVYLEWESREKEPDKTAEEILHEHTKDSQWYAPVCDKRIIEAMEAYARQSQINLRDELIKYTIWHEELLYKCHALEEAIEHGVDEYLKQKDNG